MANENVMTVLDEPIAKISYLTRLRMHDATTIRQSSLVGGALLVGAFAGFVVGAAVTNSRLGKEFDDRLSAELLEMKAKELGLPTGNSEPVEESLITMIQKYKKLIKESSVPTKSLRERLGLDS